MIPRPDATATPSGVPARLTFRAIASISPRISHRTSRASESSAPSGVSRSPEMMFVLNFFDEIRRTASCGSRTALAADQVYRVSAESSGSCLVAKWRGMAYEESLASTAFIAREFVPGSLTCGWRCVRDSLRDRMCTITLPNPQVRCSGRNQRCRDRRDENYAT